MNCADYFMNEAKKQILTIMENYNIFLTLFTSEVGQLKLVLHESVNLKFKLTG